MVLHQYQVTSPEEVLLYGDNWTETEFYGADWVEVQAPNKRQAKILAIKQMKEWPKQARGDGKNPFARLKVEHIECEHVGCWYCSDPIAVDYCKICAGESTQASEDIQW